MALGFNWMLAWCCDPLCCVFDLRRPFSCPHDRCYTIMACILAVSSWASGIMMLRSCYFERVQQRNQETGQPIPGTMRGYGFFSRQVEQGQEPDYQDCIAFTEVELQVTFNDGWWMMGKAASILSMIFGSFGMILVLSTCCLAYHLHMFEKLLLWIYIFAAFFQAFSFLGYGTHFCRENICRVGQGAGLAITNFMMWLTCANTVKSFPEALPPERYSEDSDEDEDGSDDDWYYDSDNEQQNANKSNRRSVPDQKKDGSDEDSDDDDSESDSEFDSDEDEEDPNPDYPRLKTSNSSVAQSSVAQSSVAQSSVAQSSVAESDRPNEYHGEMVLA